MTMTQEYVLLRTQNNVACWKHMDAEFSDEINLTKRKFMIYKWPAQEPNLSSSLDGGGHKKMWHCGNIIMWHVGHTVLWEVTEHDTMMISPPKKMNLQKFKSREISHNTRKKKLKRLKWNKNWSRGDEGANPQKTGDRQKIPWRLLTSSRRTSWAFVRESKKLNFLLPSQQTETAHK